jgi:hypothetical protein
LATVGANGVGLTVIEKLCGFPIHEFAVGVTEITPVIEADPVFNALKEDILPIPDAPIPIAEFVFDQIYEALVMFPENVVIGTISPLQ